MKEDIKDLSKMMNDKRRVKILYPNEQNALCANFSENVVPIVFSVDENYLPYLSVALCSLLENANKDKNYDIFVLYKKLSDDGMQKLSDFVRGFCNASLSFVNISQCIENAKQKAHFHTAVHFTEATYYRFFVPMLFKKFEKLFYVDSDMIFLKDIAPLLELDLENFILGAVKEYVAIVSFLNKKDGYYANFYKNKKPFKDIKNYFQAGFLIYNIKQCLSFDFLDTCLKKLEYLQYPPTVDQDVLNSCFERQVKFLDPRYNYTWNLGIRYPEFEKLLPENLAKEALLSYNEPFVIHYNDFFKPWNAPQYFLAKFWWQYARKTPFYEEILFKDIKKIALVERKENKLTGAAKRIKSQLSYKLGKALLKAKNPLFALALPFVLPYLVLKHKKTQKMVKDLIELNPNLKPPLLEQYSDYEEGLKVKEHLSYKLGSNLIKNPFSFIFQIGMICKKHKGKK